MSSYEYYVNIVVTIFIQIQIKLINFTQVVSFVIICKIGIIFLRAAPHWVRPHPVNPLLILTFG